MYRHKLLGKDNRELITRAIEKIKRDFSNFSRIYETNKEEVEDKLFEIYTPLVRKKIIMYLSFLGKKTDSQSIYRLIISNLKAEADTYIPNISNKVFQIVFNNMFESKERYKISDSTVKTVWAFIIVHIHYEKLDHYLSKSMKYVAEKTFEDLGL